MPSKQELEKRIDRLEAALRVARSGFELLHTRALKGLTEEDILACVHNKGAIDRVLHK